MLVFERGESEWEGRPGGRWGVMGHQKQPFGVVVCAEIEFLGALPACFLQSHCGEMP